jgi:glycosyltransferase involved in cell wall biosynthesis
VKIASSIRTIAFLGDYLPRKCGIATFTSDLLGAVAARHPQSRCFAVPVNDIEGCYRYPDVVRFEIEEQDLESYRCAADFLNTSNVDIVSVQHEFGIFGGPAGSHLLALLRGLTAPVVTTLHTVLRTPNADQLRVMQGLIARSTRLVVMTERGRNLLQEVYQAPPAKIDLIPHGIPDVPFVAPDRYKRQFGVSGRRVLLTFGLLSPNKGIEHVLNALPDIVAEFPDVVYSRHLRLDTEGAVDAATWLLRRLLDTPVSAVGAVLRGFRCRTSVPVEQSSPGGEKQRHFPCGSLDQRVYRRRETRHRDFSRGFQAGHDRDRCCRRSDLCAHLLRAMGYVFTLSLWRILWVVRSPLRG